ncbi:MULTISPECIES: amino acid permease [Acinetobacter]|uniref:Amino acid permease n=1 Tax=Acinetobacter chengduensis TaxID=2420890 RepID=A0ABX9TY40_9GAMM|nr:MULTISPECIES: amino acid permease [Acinetobacter]MBI1450775.1 amino acid permease [Acinetobacter sp. FL51]RKG42695.1 amino acid permease [Acinetobacter sp. WCHAc060007]RLL22776.1 amino acid permease [Acinetobacter chengduensis]
MSTPSDSTQTSASGDSPSLKRAMTTRHLIMLSLGGAIGTGLFMGSGEVISQAGPLGAVLAYIIGGLIAYMVMLCLGELAVHLPVSGSFGAFATNYIGPGTGYMVSWMYWLGWSATLGTEFTAAAILVQEWFPQTSIWLWTLIFAAGVLISNLSSTRAFAESEFWLSMVKVATVLVFILLGFSCIFGFIPFDGYSSAPMFNNLTEHGWLPNGLFPLFATLLIVNFAFNGTEMIGIAAGETENPEKNVPKAIHAAVWRLIIFFVGTIVVISSLLTYTDAGLNVGGHGGLSSSPFVSVFQHMGIPYAEDIIRFVIITALLSTANSGLYAASRMMWALSAQKQLPRVFSKVNKAGVPVVAIWVTMIGGLPGLLSEQFGADVIFKNLMGVAAFTMVIVWMSICWSQFNFRRQWLKQGHSVSELKFHTPWFPLVPILGFVCCTATGLSMAADPEMLSGFIGCLLFMAACYASYYWLYHNKN